MAYAAYNADETVAAGSICVEPSTDFLTKEEWVEATNYGGDPNFLIEELYAELEFPAFAICDSEETRTMAVYAKLGDSEADFNVSHYSQMSSQTVYPQFYGPGGQASQTYTLDFWYNRLSESYAPATVLFYGPLFTVDHTLSGVTGLLAGENNGNNFELWIGGVTYTIKNRWVSTDRWPSGDPYQDSHIDGDEGVGGFDVAHKPGDAYYHEFMLNKSTGLTDADSLPTCEARHNGVIDSSFTLTVTDVGDGHYKVAGTVPSGYVSGDTVTITRKAVFGDYTFGAVIDKFIIDASRVDEVETKVDTVDAVVDGIATAVGTVDTVVDGIATAVAGLDIDGIPAAVDVTLSAAHGNGNWESSSLRGTGADQVTVLIRMGGVAVEDAAVWITSDAAGAHVVAGTMYTNASGEVMFLLDAGTTYYLWAEKSGMNPILGDEFAAVADSE